VFGSGRAAPAVNPLNVDANTIWETPLGILAVHDFDAAGRSPVDGLDAKGVIQGGEACPQVIAA
jgi:hypothetical protein